MFAAVKLTQKASHWRKIRTRRGEEKKEGGGLEFTSNRGPRRRACNVPHAAFRAVSREFRALVAAYKQDGGEDVRPEFENTALSGRH
ncbi:hypothetical protein EVAR_57100_1 [Eumeta japonica]|uniref:Uncharacterized protein n=1 Tax=Eumeta variegata TaxID=151549 RepID=A0A4C1YFF3_EUMVA|nr:hypothetical protein EVAR_57100_1 [Eumeta japonica]